MNMNIGQAAKHSGLTAKMIRYYESIGLLTPAGRGANGYRHYNERDLHQLAFIRRARDLGFSLDQIRALLDLSDDGGRPCEAVDEIARRHLVEVERKIADLTALRQELDRMLAHCGSGTVSECRIIETLSPG